MFCCEFAYLWFDSSDQIVFWKQTSAFLILQFMLLLFANPSPFCLFLQKCVAFVHMGIKDDYLQHASFLSQLKVEVQNLKRQMERSLR